MNGIVKGENNNVNHRPMFSIGVTTYNRLGMLTECIASLTQQTFSDFEVIVGNDYTSHNLSAEKLGISDPRIRFVNHPKNLGELANANSLLGRSRGRYFTWLADDDIYNLEILQSVYSTLAKYNFPTCLFTSYKMGDKYINKTETSKQEEQIFEGRDYLQNYLSKSVKILGCYGFFDLNYLINIGGWEQLGDGFSPYSDNLLAIRAGLLEQVIYIDAPLIFFRTHEGSISLTSNNLNAYISAQVDLVHKCLPILKNKKLIGDYDLNMFFIIKWCMEDIIAVAYRSGSMGGKQMTSHLLYLMKHIRRLKRYDLYLKMIINLIKILLKTTMKLLCPINYKLARSSLKQKSI